jgi:hypothetical protein
MRKTDFFISGAAYANHFARETGKYFNKMLKI